MDEPKGFPNVLALAVVCLVGFGWMVSPVRAQTTVNANWTDQGGDWTGASSWSCNCVPNNNSATEFNVAIPEGSVLLGSNSIPKSVTINTLSTGTSEGVAFLHIESGATLSVTGSLYVASTGVLGIDDEGENPGGSALHVGGNLVDNSRYDDSLQIGFGYGQMTTLPSTVTVAGTFSGTASLSMSGGGVAGAQALLNVGGAAPSTLAAHFFLEGDTGGAAVEYGSGGITQIGDGSVAALVLYGPNAYMELSSAPGSNSALAGLKTIASNAYLWLNAGASVTTTGPLTNTGDVALNLTNFGGAVSPVTVLNVGGAAPSTLVGDYELYGSTNGAALEYAGGGITQIGDRSTSGGQLTITGPNAYVELSSATGSNSALTPLKTIASNGQLNLDDGALVNTTGTLTNDGNIDVNAPTTGDAVVYQRPSTLSLGGDLTNGGSVTLGQEHGSAVLTVKGNLTNTPGGHLELDGAQLSVSGGVNNSGTITVSPSTLGPSGVESSSFINSGTLTVGAAGASENASSLTVGSGGTYTQTAGSTRVSGTLMAPSVNITGGKLFGRGTIDGNVVNSGTVSAEDLSAPTLDTTLTINGNYTQSANGTLVVDLNCCALSSLDVTGKASLDGTVDFDFLGVPGPNTDFAGFLKAGSVTGDFTAVNIVGINCPTCRFDPSTLSLDTGSAQPTPSPELGSLILFGTGLLGLVFLLRRELWIVIWGVGDQYQSRSGLRRGVRPVLGLSIQDSLVVALLAAHNDWQCRGGAEIAESPASGWRAKAVWAAHFITS
jgi:hypothetical protein